VYDWKLSLCRGNIKRCQYFRLKLNTTFITTQRGKNVICFACDWNCAFLEVKNILRIFSLKETSGKRVESPFISVSGRRIFGINSHYCTSELGVMTTKSITFSKNWQRFLWISASNLSCSLFVLIFPTPPPPRN
jgi:hypothetical protein